MKTLNATFDRVDVIGSVLKHGIPAGFAMLELWPYPRCKELIADLLEDEELPHD